MTETKFLQEEIETLLNKKLNGVKAKREWKVTNNRTDGYDPKLLYAPILDIGVEPFLIKRVSPEETQKLDIAFERNKLLIEKIIHEGATFEEFEYNYNPRCLIAIEIETSGSKKHLIKTIFFNIFTCNFSFFCAN